MTTLPTLLLAGASGLALGSYAVTTGLRLAMPGTAHGVRSRCDTCGETLDFASTVPVASYVWLRGACSHCGSQIDPIHLGGEVAGALVLLSAPWEQSIQRALIISAIGLLLIAAAASDLKSLRLPDPVTLSVATGSLLLAVLAGPEQLLKGVCAAGLVGLSLWIVRALSRRAASSHGLGFGDVKLAAALALWLGAATPLMILVSSLLGLAAAPFLRDGRGRLPFGPMIAIAGWSIGIAAERGWLRWAL
jgi:leader peptidase (prepilin peptidase) / N-methyltransferase